MKNTNLKFNYYVTEFEFHLVFETVGFSSDKAKYYETDKSNSVLYFRNRYEENEIHR